MVKYILNDGGSVLVTSYASHLCKLQHQHQSVECDACECDYGHTGRRPLRTLVPFGPAGVGASPCFLFSPLSLFPPLGQNLSLSLSLTQPHRRFRLFRFGFLPLEAIARSTPPPPPPKTQTPPRRRGSPRMDPPSPPDVLSRSDVLSWIADRTSIGQFVVHLPGHRLIKPS